MGLLRSFLESTVFQIRASLAATAGALIAYCRIFSFSFHFLSSLYAVEPNATYGSFASDYPERLPHVGYFYENLSSQGVSLLSSRFGRSAGSPGEPILWSVLDRSLVSPHIRKIHF